MAGTGTHACAWNKPGASRCCNATYRLLRCGSINTSSPQGLRSRAVVKVRLASMRNFMDPSQYVAPQSESGVNEHNFIQYTRQQMKLYIAYL